ncbi:MAG: glycogen synthase GlgA [Holophaga sp.]|nr:glycogen synthase GlgA [Holophaga sp.]
MRILHVATELFPYVKVGGLADVLAALPAAQRSLGADARVLLPGFPALIQGIPGLEPAFAGADLMGLGPARCLLGRTGNGVPIYLLDCPALFDRPGGPYEESGDSHRKFGALALAAADLAMAGDNQGWRPELVQAHDWQAGLVPALLAQRGADRPRTVMTIHNLAYQGLYPRALLPELGLDPSCFHPGGVEFYGKINFLKAGLAYADRITTVSPTYAAEIQLPAGGAGLDGLLAQRSRDLSGILNGVDYRVWNPATSPHLEVHFDSRLMSARKINKNLLQRAMGLEETADVPLFAVISRLAEQKGLDLVLENIAYLIQLNAQLLVLGTGAPELESGFHAAALAHPGQVAVDLGFDEGLAHRILAGADVVLVPSRQEPCGLTQLYALRYGALPLVRRTGGLADTVVDADAQSMMDGTATGFVFNEPNSWILGETIGRACQLYRQDPKAWLRIQRRAMAQDFGWESAAREYLDLYRHLLG